MNQKRRGGHSRFLSFRVKWRNRIKSGKKRLSFAISGRMRCLDRLGMTTGRDLRL